MKPRLAKLYAVACGNSQSEQPPFDPGLDWSTYIPYTIGLRPASSLSKRRLSQVATLTS
ncbi:hypothetical protein GO003_020240 [Methylicorpusculum oleiharenae]|uniref:hypothetical protein n=1 Tax=Methylicorpusculum oleiharenae TaxID=1338687 RepID=UPI00135C7967|nr:hypothetical protein [Methylicorpusculum oleiharenae]MCD2452718.1 hypothetical protein [Methylicorpusculum oleiharenae]